MSSFPYRKLSEWDFEEGLARIAQVAIAMMSFEYLSVGIFFMAGCFQWERTALIFQFLFLVLAAATEFVCYEKIGAPFADQIVQGIMVIPVHLLRIPKAMFKLVSLAPNYVHVISSAVAAGVSFVVWESPPNGDPVDLHNDHYRNWHDTPVIGHFVATQGIPHLLTGLLIFSMFIHAILPPLWYFSFSVRSVWNEKNKIFVIGELCDCANLQFLKKALFKTPRVDRDTQVLQISRLLIALFVKYPLLWLKTSFLAVMWEYMDSHMRRSMLIAILLAWYGLLQLMPTFLMQAHYLYQLVKDELDDFDWKFSEARDVAIPVMSIFTIFYTALLVVGLVQQFLHLGGIWWCPKTHDFSLFHGGCTVAA